MKTAKCTKCPKSFTHPTEQKAQQALAMHVGRMHTGRIPSPQRHSGVLRQNGNGSLTAVAEVKVHGRSNLKKEEVGTILTFIRNRKSEFPNKTACVVAALDAAGATGRIKPNSTAVNRYFAKAAAMPENYSGLEVSPAAPTKREYTKKTKPAAAHQITVKFCPCCGTNMEAVATGLAMAAHMH